MIQISEDEVELSSGRRVSANCGIIGIDPDGFTFEGYDSGLLDADFTAEERRDLALGMIARWADYGNVTSKDVAEVLGEKGVGP